MNAMADRVERMATEEPRMRATRWLAQRRPRALVVAPVVEQPTDEKKLIWDLQVKAIPIFNGERQAEMIKTFTTAFSEAIETMNMGNNETLMKAIFMSKLGAVARTWKQCVERGQPAEVPKTTMEWLERLKRDFYPEEMSKIKWAELTELRQDHHSLQWLIQAFTGLRNQVEHKTEEEIVRQFGIAANGHGNFKNIGQVILDESICRAIIGKPMTFLTAIHMAEKFASQEVEMRRTNNQVQRGQK
jgi:disulfide oxidoreductase YuzD